MSLPFPGSESVLSWALTYWIHSAVLTALAWLAIRGFKPRSNPVREAIWTAALFGAFVTTAMQTTGGVASRLATFEIPQRLPEDVSRVGPRVRDVRSDETTGRDTNVPPGIVESTGAPSLLNGSPKSLSERVGTPILLRSESPKAMSLGANTTSPGSSRSRNDANSRGTRIREFVATRVLAPLRARGGAVLLLGAALGALWLGWLFVRSRSALASRIPLIDHPLNEQLAQLRARFGMGREVALSISDRIATPVAFGIRRFEICVPERVLSDLDDRQREAMLAHELAHLVRNDPLRLLLARAVESIFFFQPFHRLARRELFEVIERRCDAYAVERLGGGLALAGCLAEVASWLVMRPRRALAPAMAESKSALCQRIEQLLDEDATLELDRRQRGFAPLVIAAVPLVALIVPGFAVARAVKTELPTASARATRIESSDQGSRFPPPAPATAEETADFAAGDLEDIELDEIDLDEVVALLDAEICALATEIAELRNLLGDTRDPRFEPTLEALEDRLDLLEERRLSLAALWRARAQDPYGENSDPDPAWDDEAWRNR